VDRGTDPAWLAKELLRWFRLALLAQVSPQVLGLEVPPETASRIAAKASTLPRSRVLATLRSLSEAISQRYSAQPRIDLELALIRVVMPAEELSLQTISDRLRSLEEKVGGRDGSPPPISPAPSTKRPLAAGGQARKTRERSSSAQPLPSEPEMSGATSDATDTLTVSKLRALWPHVISAVKERSKPCYGHLEHATIVDATALTVTLGVPSKFNRDLLAEPGMSGVVREAIREVAGATVSVQCVVVAGLASKPSGTDADPGAFALAESVLGTDFF
jgi:DNA polymerase III gamma/tau subunit